MSGKLIIVTAPSGAGKTTVVKHLLNTIPSLAFSVSATTRNKRENEVDGKDYYFLSNDAFKSKIASNEFVEWEEVYPGKFYGTLEGELSRLWKDGKNIIFDVDVKGALSLKNKYPEKTLSIFIQPPSLEILIERLKKSKEDIEKCINILKENTLNGYFTSFHSTEEPDSLFSNEIVKLLSVN